MHKLTAPQQALLIKLSDRWVDRDEDDDAQPVCRTCGKPYKDGADGYDGECPPCADKTEENAPEPVNPMPSAKTPTHCQDCGKVWKLHELDTIDDPTLRIEAGEPMPHGQCPQCGALCTLLRTTTPALGRMIELESKRDALGDDSPAQEAWHATADGTHFGLDVVNNNERA